jgi:hypothetical protein
VRRRELQPLTVQAEPDSESQTRKEKTTMQDTIARIFENFVGRVHGPMSFRLFLQPTMAVIFAIRDGRTDARDGRVAYFWSLLTQPGHRIEHFR